MTFGKPRPWFVVDAVCDDYRASLRDGGDLKMLKALKIIRAIVVSLGIIVISLYSIGQGGDPTYLGLLALLILGGYSGLEFSDYFALIQAYQELQESKGEDDDDD